MVISDEELAAIKARCEAAAEGPWTAHGCEVRGKEWKDERDYHYSMHIYDEGGHGEDDAAFIAHARTDVPRLLAELEREKERTAVAVQNCQVAMRNGESANVARDLAMARCALLGAELERACVVVEAARAVGQYMTPKRRDSLGQPAVFQWLYEALRVYDAGKEGLMVIVTHDLLKELERLQRWQQIARHFEESTTLCAQSGCAHCIETGKAAEKKFITERDELKNLRSIARIISEMRAAQRTKDFSGGPFLDRLYEAVDNWEKGLES